MTYSRNMARLKERSRQNLNTRISQRTNAAKLEGDRQILQANYVANQLSAFSKQLHDWKLKDIKKQEAEGAAKLEEIETEKAEHALLKEEYRQANSKNTQEFFNLALTIEEAKQREQELLILKNNLLEKGGEGAYPEAQRIAQLSPHQQVGYLKAKLGSVAETYGDKLKHAMANSNTKIQVGDYTFTSAQLREDNIHSLPLKEAALRVHSKNILKASGVDKFSPEMLAISGVLDAVKSANKGLLDEYRERFNIDSSSNERLKHKKEFFSIPATELTGFDLYHLFLGYNGTVNEKNTPISRSQAWDLVFADLIAEGVAKDLTVLNKYRNLEIPENMRKSLSASGIKIKPGTTFGQHFEPRFNDAEKKIMKTKKENTNAKRDYYDSLSEEKANEFREELINNKGQMTRERVRFWEDEAYRVGGKLPTVLKNYKTTIERNIEDDKATIKSIIAMNRGYISPDALEAFHPEAAVEYWEVAQSQHKALKERENVDGLIVEKLNETMAGAAIKTNEKGHVYEFAKTQAIKDFDTKFFNLVAHGYDTKSAAQLALYGSKDNIKSKTTGEDLGMFEGVITHIATNGANNKYTKFSDDQLKSLDEAKLRIKGADVAKRQLLQNSVADQTELLGGDYGRKQLDTLKENIEKFGTWKGVWKSENAFEFYRSISRGKRGMYALGLIDAQLKYDGHPGIFPNRTIYIQNGRIKAGINSIEPTKYGGSIETYNQVQNNTQSLMNYYMGKPSEWDKDENLVPYLRSLGGTE